MSIKAFLIFFRKRAMKPILSGISSGRMKAKNTAPFSATEAKQ